LHAAGHGEDDLRVDVHLGARARFVRDDLAARPFGLDAPDAHPEVAVRELLPRLGELASDEVGYATLPRCGGRRRRRQRLRPGVEGVRLGRRGVVVARREPEPCRDEDEYQQHPEERRQEARAEIRREPPRRLWGHVLLEDDRVAAADRPVSRFDRIRAVLLGDAPLLLAGERLLLRR
jgi:hypothetical protein